MPGLPLPERRSLELRGPANDEGEGAIRYAAHILALAYLLALTAVVAAKSARWPDPPAWWTAAAMCVHRYESTDWHQHGYYSGGYQFLDSTWHAVGGHGRAGDASREEQTYRAWLLYQRVGWAAWPNTSRLCGLR